MATYIHIGNGTKKTFTVKAAPVGAARIVRVDAEFTDWAGGPEATSVTLTTAPASGAVVEVMDYIIPVGTSDDLRAALNKKVNFGPVAIAPQFLPPFPPVVRFIGTGADAVPYTIDPKAAQLNVWADGTVQTTY